MEISLGYFPIIQIDELKGCSNDDKMTDIDTWPYLTLPTIVIEFMSVLRRC